MTWKVSTGERVRSFVLDVLPAGVDTPSGGHVRLELDGRVAGPDAIAPTLVCGDPQDLTGDARHLGNGILLRADPADGSFRLSSSLSGLPALYLCRHDRGTTLATTPGPLLRRQGSARRFDPPTVRHLGLTGRPVPGRTLFAGITLVPPGRTFTIDASGRIREESRSGPDGESPTEPDDYLLQQRRALRRAVARMDLSRSVLSLTAGLDTRTILAVMSEQERFTDAVTLCGERDSIDARRAGELARALGFEHQVVRLDGRYLVQLPELCAAASRRSDGLASFDQAPDLHLHRELGDRYEARLSGFLGNQIGRASNEGISLRGADLRILAEPLRPRPGQEDTGHWMLDAAAGRSLEDPSFLVEVESLTSSLANYALGSTVCLQQAPYADRDVILNRLRGPRPAGRRGLLSHRWADLRYRFLGQPVQTSFQRQLIVEAGGFASTCPVNWGWRPTGGIGGRALAWGVLGFLDAALGTLGRRLAPARTLRQRTGVAGLYEFERATWLYRGGMPDFVRETVLSARVLGAGLFDPARIRRLLEEEFDDPGHRATIVFALDLALAWRNFLSADPPAAP